MKYFGIVAVLSLASVQGQFLQNAKETVAPARILEVKTPTMMMDSVHGALEKIDYIESALTQKDATSLLKQSDAWRRIAKVMEEIEKMATKEAPMDYKKLEEMRKEVESVMKESESLKMSGENQIDIFFFDKFAIFCQGLLTLISQIPPEYQFFPLNLIAPFIQQYKTINAEVYESPELEVVFGDSLGTTVKNIYDIVGDMVAVDDQHYEMTEAENQKVEQDFIIQTILLKKLRYFGLLLRAFLNLKTTTTTTTSTTTAAATTTSSTTSTTTTTTTPTTTTTTTTTAEA